MKNQRNKKILKILVFLVIFIILFCIIGSFLNPTNTVKEWFQSHAVTEFYRENKNTIDVLYVGTSCIYTGVSPLEIYDRTGITGYDFASPEQSIWSSYYYIKEAFNTQKPKVVFIEVGKVFSGKNTNTESKARKAIDSLRFGKTKLEMIFDECYGLSNFDKLSCIFPALRYHSRWSSMDGNDFKKFNSSINYTYKGYLFDKRTKSYAGVIKRKTKQKNEVSSEEIAEKIAEIPDEVDIKIDKMIEICRQNNASLIFIKIPEPKLWNIEKNEIITKYAEEKGVGFIDLNYDENINIDWKKDTQDEGTHLNVFGAEKVGKYLSDYLSDKFEFEDHRNDDNYKEWNSRLEEYKKAKGS